MRARSRSEVASLDEARALLGLSGSEDDAARKAAFRAAIKAARPEPGADDALFRRTIAAWRVVRDAGAMSAAPILPLKPSAPTITVDPLTALRGGRIETRLGGRTVLVRVPRGSRTGDKVTLKGAAADGANVRAAIVIRGADGLRVVGDDLYMDWPITPRLLADGGRLEVETHAGPRSAWIVPGQPSLRLRLKDLGLPARRKHAKGHLFVTLIPAADAPSPTEDRLAAFTRVWTPGRLAA